MFPSERDTVYTNLLPPEYAPTPTELGTPVGGSLILPFPNILRSTPTGPEVANAEFQIWTRMRFVNPEAGRVGRYVPTAPDEHQLYIRPPLKNPTTIDEKRADLDPQSSLIGAIYETPFVVVPAHPRDIPLVIKTRIPVDHSYYNLRKAWITKLRRIVLPQNGHHNHTELDIDDFLGPETPQLPDEQLDYWLKLAQRPASVALMRTYERKGTSVEVKTAFGDQQVQNDGTTEVQERTKEFEQPEGGHDDYMELTVDQMSWFDAESNQWKRTLLLFKEGQPHLIEWSIYQATAEEYQAAFAYSVKDSLVGPDGKPIIGDLRGVKRLNGLGGFSNLKPAGMFRLLLVMENMQSRPRMKVGYVRRPSKKA